MLDRCGGMQSALKLAADFEQAAHLVAQVARARHYPDLECRQHSSDAAGQYLSLLVEAHITPRLCYTTVGVRSAFEKGDYPQQALLVDTWTSLDPISPPSLVLINAALEQSTEDSGLIINITALECSPGQMVTVIMDTSHMV